MKRTSLALVVHVLITFCFQQVSPEPTNCTLPQTLLQTKATISNGKLFPVLLKVNFYTEQFLNRQKIYTLLLIFLLMYLNLMF